MDRAYLEKLFAYSHLPPHLQEVSKPFHDLAMRLHDTLLASPDLTIALRKLLEAKDAAVRTRVIWGENL
jgi:hypothetical protein